MLKFQNSKTKEPPNAPVKIKRPVQREGKLVPRSLHWDFLVAEQHNQPNQQIVQNNVPPTASSSCK